MIGSFWFLLFTRKRKKTCLIAHFLCLSPRTASANLDNIIKTKLPERMREREDQTAILLYHFSHSLRRVRLCNQFNSFDQPITWYVYWICVVSYSCLHLPSKHRHQPMANFEEAYKTRERTCTVKKHKKMVASKPIRCFNQMIFNQNHIKNDDDDDVSNDLKSRL